MLSATDEGSIDDDGENFRSIIEKLHDKFNDKETEKSLKIQILTLLPEKWSERRICETLNSSRHLSRVAHVQKLSIYYLCMFYPSKH